MNVMLCISISPSCGLGGLQFVVLVSFLIQDVESFPAQGLGFLADWDFGGSRRFWREVLDGCEERVGGTGVLLKVSVAIVIGTSAASLLKVSVAIVIGTSAASLLKVSVAIVIGTSPLSLLKVSTGME